MRLLLDESVPKRLRNDLPNLLPLVPNLEIALAKLVAGSCVNVDAPKIES
jgi:hypothetical protein